MDWLEILILGAVQGLTEFLPISSDGHLTIAQHLFAAFRGTERTGAENLFIDVMLHLGTTAAILLHYRPTIAAGARGLIEDPKPAPRVDDPELAPESPGLSPYRRENVVRVLLLAAVATLPAVPVGLFLKKALEKTLEGTAWSGAGFLVTAAVLLLTVKLKGGDKGPERTTWLDALLVGIAQMFAPLPGVSRSGLTIAAALGLGFKRTWAVGFSLLMAVPVIAGAAILELRKVDLHALPPGRMGQIAAAAVVSFLVGYAAILWLVRVVQSGRMWYFSVYLIVLGVAVLGWSVFQGRSPDARRATALDRPLRVVAPGPGPDAHAGRVRGALDRPVAPGEDAGDPRPRATVGDRPGASGLLLGRPLAGGEDAPE